ncbi:MAG: hypothetical protein WD512_18570 [Candidatus Paceibacterota bacterium]
MIINYKGNEKEITEPFFIQLYNKAKKLDDSILMNDISSILYDNNIFDFKLSCERLEEAFRTAVYNGTYEAIKLEMICKDKLYNRN